MRSKVVNHILHRLFNQLHLRIFECLLIFSHNHNGSIKGHCGQTKIKAEFVENQCSEAVLRKAFDQAFLIHIRSEWSAILLHVRDKLNVATNELLEVVKRRNCLVVNAVGQLANVLCARNDNDTPLFHPFFCLKKSAYLLCKLSRHRPKMDVSTLLGWSAFVGFSLTTTCTWFPYGSAVGNWHDKNKLRPSALFVTVFNAVTCVPFVLALWAFTRSFPADGVMYILAHAFTIAALLMEKLWFILHWDRRSFGWAALIAALAAAFFIAASVFVGLTGANTGKWEHIPLLVMLPGAALWYIWICGEEATIK